VSRVAAALLACVAVLLPDGRVIAQSRFGGQLRGVLSLAGVERDQTGLTAQLDGTLIGLDGTLRYGMLELSGRYLEGGIEREGGAAAQDLIDGELQVRVRPLRFLAIGLGPHARSYVEAGTERWLVWEASAALSMWLVQDVLRSSLDLRLGLGGSVNSGAPFGAGRSVAGGLELRFPRTPIFVGVAYSVDRLSLADDARIDTVEQFVVRAGIWP
jgi:hypothetical protein